MTILQALFLGVVQGLTEFLPISSSGHLAIAEHYLHLSMNQESLQGFDVLLHAGTLLALILCYWSTWWRLLLSPFRRDRSSSSLLLLIIIATFPAVVVGPFLKDAVMASLRTPLSLGIQFGLSGLILIAAEKRESWWPIHRLKGRHALIIGAAQALALVPALSRSGLTISAGRFLGIDRREALDFSFLMAVPAIAGAVTLTLYEALRQPITFPAPTVMALGVAAAFFSSIIAILFLRRWVVTHRLSWFALYLIPLSLFLIVSSAF